MPRYFMEMSVKMAKERKIISIEWEIHVHHVFKWPLNMFGDAIIVITVVIDVLPEKGVAAARSI